jgi:mannose/fructose/N-acetylgalactosamine-specific phosphotransferase system component IIC
MKKLDTVYVINGKNIDKLIKNDKGEFINSNPPNQYNNDPKPSFQPINKVVLAITGVAIIGAMAFMVYKLMQKKKNKHHTHKKDNDLDSDTD